MSISFHTAEIEDFEKDFVQYCTLLHWNSSTSQLHITYINYIAQIDLLNYCVANDTSYIAKIPIGTQYTIDDFKHYLGRNLRYNDSLIKEIMNQINKYPEILY